MKPLFSSFCIVRLLVLTASFALNHSLSAAGARPSAVQEALKKQGFYFGEVNGVVDDQTKAALKRFQIREGLTVTGEIDAATVAALEKKPSSSGDASLQKIPARERAQKVIQSDQEFLGKVESIEESRAPAPPGNLRIANEVPSPAPATDKSSPGSSVAVAPPPQPSEALANEPLAPVAEPPRAVTEYAPRTASSGSTLTPAGASQKPVADKTRAKQSPGSKREKPEPVAERVPSTTRDYLPPAPSDSATEPSLAARPAISEAEAREFVRDYLKAAEGPTPAGEVAFYGEQVDYFDSGKVPRTFIEKDQRNYYRRWPVRDFELVSAPQIDRLSGNDATVRFRMRYSLRGGKETAKGLTENVVRVRKAGAALKIVAIRERKIRE